ncbi:MAG: hypothetical protein KZQ65_12585, partial [Candidatus Thiodiazotropha sp. (ex Gloverina cf. vestifex)]|nr:hypothetical protein [Candidatus Thiodiazotropha sp. (ex Gloverina cf. vestifex)]
VTITAIQPRLRLSGTNRLGFQPSMAISESSYSKARPEHKESAWCWSDAPVAIRIARCQEKLRKKVLVARRSH